MAASPRLALRLGGLQVYSRLLARSPGKALCAAPGAHQPRMAFSPRLALRLAGLQVYSRLLACSPM
ncbi:hypothetical protein NGG03_18100 [Klebsiella michiganensis]|uniref:hypothetical protein n=1 Tax=Klebsiella michiganensis TaxID=1134687 RepID=UPI002DB75951|nr:hypothetical protein [Klebsiella michiganensis]MEB8291822.1 hypothetical protein [Klebsiella michiganensis]